MIDVGSANNKAGELRGYAAQLRLVKSTLLQYQGVIRGGWSAPEVSYYMRALGEVQNKLQQASDELDSIAGAVSSTASQIRHEEEEAARRAEEARRAAAAAEAARIAAEAEAARIAEENRKAEEAKQQQVVARAVQAAGSVASILARLRW